MMTNKRFIPWIVSGVLVATVTALALLTAAPAQASAGWGFGMAFSPSVVASCTSYNVVPARVDVPKGEYAGYITGRLSNTRTGAVRKPAFGMDTVYNAGSPSLGYVIFNPPEGTVDGDILHVSLTLYDSPAMANRVGSFEFSYRCSNGEIVHTAGYSGDPINIGYGDNLVVVARGRDSEGSPDVEVWCLDPSGYASTLSLKFSKETLAGLPQYPAINTQIDKNNSCLVPVAAYVLTTGEYQVTIGPDGYGVINQVIFTSLSPTQTYFRRYNVNQPF